MFVWFVNEKDVELMPFNEDVARIADAAALGLPAGRWPDRLCTDDIGDGTDLINKGWVCSDAMIFIQPSTGMEVHIVND